MSDFNLWPVTVRWTPPCDTHRPLNITGSRHHLSHRVAAQLPQLEKQLEAKANHAGGLRVQYSCWERLCWYLPISLGITEHLRGTAGTIMNGDVNPVCFTSVVSWWSLIQSTPTSAGGVNNPDQSPTYEHRDHTETDGLLWYHRTSVWRVNYHKTYKNRIHGSSEPFWLLLDRPHHPTFISPSSETQNILVTESQSSQADKNAKSGTLNLLLKRLRMAECFSPQPIWWRPGPPTGQEQVIIGQIGP